MEVVVLAAGQGIRFKSKADEFPEFKKPKPMIDVNGKSILEWTLESLPKKFWDEEVDIVTVAVLASASEEYRQHIRDVVRRVTGRPHQVISMHREQLGNLHTAYMSVRNTTRPSLRDSDILFLDADNHWDGLRFQEYLRATKTILGINTPFTMTVGFEPIEMEDGKWCYATHKAGTVYGISEKKYPQKIRTRDQVDAMMGVFYFSSVRDFIERAERILKWNHGGPYSNGGEYYMSSALMVPGTYTFIFHTDSVMPLGTPEDVAKVDWRYAESSKIADKIIDDLNRRTVQRATTPEADKIWSNVREVARNAPEWAKEKLGKLRICFDLDGTICTTKKDGETYADVKPIPGAIETIRRLRESGHTIIIQTARHMRTCEGNVGKVLAKQGAVTLKWLDDHNVPYDEIHFGKPHADIFVCDKAIRHNEGEDWSVRTNEELQQRMDVLASR